MSHVHRFLPVLLLPFALGASGCSGVQSALDPAGAEAERAAVLFAWLAAGAAVLWVFVVALAWYAPRARAFQDESAARRLIVGGGVVLPIVVLTAISAYGLAEMPRVLAPAPPGSLEVEVIGTQWWWRVRYHRPGHPPVELANELRLPVGRRVNLRLSSTDVVHSFWVPSLAGKMDLIPGRINRLALQPTRVGAFRGACAEFCGTAHARMNFMAVVQEADTFETWFAGQAREAAPPANALAERGQQAFLTHGCVTCHTVRGTPALGVFGPDLTHVASRETIAAGTLAATPDELRRWIAQTEFLKPGVHMPAFDRLPEDTLTALAAYLAGLE